MSADLIARIRLIRSPSIGPVTFRQLLARFGTAEAALAAVPDLAARGGGKAPVLFSADAAEAETAKVDKLGMRDGWQWSLPKMPLTPEDTEDTGHSSPAPSAPSALSAAIAEDF